MTEVMIYEWFHDTMLSSSQLRELNAMVDQIRSDGYQIERNNTVRYMSASVLFDNECDAVQFKLAYL